MHKTLTTLLLASGLTLLSACDNKNGLEVGLPVDAVYLIESTRRSCAMIKSEILDPPDTPGAPDVQSAYFQLDRVNFKWSDPNSNLSIQKITLTFLGGEMPECKIAGVDLFALKMSWFTTEQPLVGSVTMVEDDGVTPRAVQPTYITTVDCPVICGGNPTGKKFTASGTMEIRGIQVDKFGNALNAPSVSISKGITIISE